MEAPRRPVRPIALLPSADLGDRQIKDRRDRRQVQQPRQGLPNPSGSSCSSSSVATLLDLWRRAASVLFEQGGQRDDSGLKIGALLDVPRRGRWDPTGGGFVSPNTSIGSRRSVRVLGLHDAQAFWVCLISPPSASPGRTRPSQSSSRKYLAIGRSLNPAASYAARAG